MKGQRKVNIIPQKLEPTSGETSPDAVCFPLSITDEEVKVTPSEPSPSSFSL
jgi:hypothetical protein